MSPAPSQFSILFNPFLDIRTVLTALLVLLGILAVAPVALSQQRSIANPNFEQPVVNDYKFANENSSAVKSNYTVTEAPTSAIVSVGGRVTTSSGMGLARVRVSISNSNGETQTVQTNLFGYYRFAEIPTGATYVFSAQTKRFSFTPLVVSVNTVLTDLDFTAQP